MGFRFFFGILTLFSEFLLVHFLVVSVEFVDEVFSFLLFFDWFFSRCLTSLLTSLTSCSSGSLSFLGVST